MSYADNPRAPKPDPSDAPQEPTGPIASDSLAAESLESGGGFADNENATALGVKGANSTLNTTDTSGATTLHAASSGAERENQDDMGLGTDEKGPSGVKYPDSGEQPQFSGRHTGQGYTGGPSSGGDTSTSGDFSERSGATGDSFADGPVTTGGSSTDTSDVTSSGVSGSSSGSGGIPDLTNSGPDAGTGVRPYTESAPNYAGDFQSEGTYKPKGSNLTEGGIPETKTFTGDVGGVHDPGRLAVQNFQNDSTNSAGMPKSQQDDEPSTGAYDALSSERI